MNPISQVLDEFFGNIAGGLIINRTGDTFSLHEEVIQIVV